MNLAFHTSILIFSLLFQYGMMWGPFGPVVDGPGGLLPEHPVQIRESQDFLKVPIIAGVTKDEGAYLAGK